MALAIVVVAPMAHAEEPNPYDARTHKDRPTESLRLGLLQSAYPFIGRIGGCEGTDPPEDRSLTREILPNLRVLAMMRSGCGPGTPPSASSCSSSSRRAAR